MSLGQLFPSGWKGPHINKTICASSFAISAFNISKRFKQSALKCFLYNTTVVWNTFELLGKYFKITETNFRKNISSFGHVSLGQLFPSGWKGPHVNKTICASSFAIRAFNVRAKDISKVLWKSFGLLGKYFKITKITFRKIFLSPRSV